MEIQASTKLTHLDEKKLRQLFHKECVKRDVGNLLETCKDTLHAAKTKSGHDPQRLSTSIEDIGWTTNAGNPLTKLVTSIDEVTYRYGEGTDETETVTENPETPETTTSSEDVNLFDVTPNRGGYDDGAKKRRRLWRKVTTKRQ